MEMRRRVIVKVHFNAAAIEADDGWHNEYASALIALVQANFDQSELHWITAAPPSMTREPARRRPQSAREFCVTLLCFTVLYGATDNGRHAVSC